MEADDSIRRLAWPANFTAEVTEILNGTRKAGRVIVPIENHDVVAAEKKSCATDL